MGRRAKNKQGDPEPLTDVNGQAGRPSAKKLGKRKAEVEDGGRESASKRPTKKLKESVSEKSEKGGQARKEINKKTKVAAIKKKQKESESESDSGEEDEVMEGGSSEGWEDVENDFDVKAEAKYVRILYLHGD